MRLRLPAVLVFSAFFAPALLLAGDPQMLRIHWEPHTTSTLETETVTTFQKPVPGGARETMKVIQTTTLRAVKDPTSPGRLVEVKFAAVRGEIGSGEKTMVFDSAKPGQANPMLEEAMGRAVGKIFVLAYDDQDRFRESRDLGGLASSPGSVTGLTALADSRDVANLFRKSLEIGLPPLAVSLGDTWTSDEVLTFPQAGDTHVQMNGKFEAVEERDGRKHAKIVFEGKLSGVTKPDKPIADTSIGEGSTMSGVILFDLERRTTTQSSYTNHLNLNVAGQVMPFEQHITSRVVSVKADD